jgi:hypothetical protein
MARPISLKGGNEMQFINPDPQYQIGSLAGGSVTAA